MKLIFLDSGDTLEFTPHPSNITKLWFEFIFKTGINSDFVSQHSSAEIAEEHIKKLNEYIDAGNELIADETYNDLRFDHCTELDQEWLNKTHKLWAYLTDRYKNEIYPAPDYWHGINQKIHALEGWYSAKFRNTKKASLPKMYSGIMTPGDGVYTHSDLVLSYNNLGRPQYEQWLLGSDIDNETNNYDSVSLTVEYHCSMNTGPKSNIGSTAPAEYIQWCNERNIPVIAPIVSLGNFTNYDKFEVKKIMQRNLITNPKMGFEL
jgi:hypothetical protein